MLSPKTLQKITYCIILVALLLAGSSQALAGDILRVDGDMLLPGGKGMTWSTAYKYLQSALADAGAGDEIWVAEGTYEPDMAFNLPPIVPGDRDASFELVNGVALYGGFDGTESSLEERDVEANPTYLSGDLLENDGPDYTNYSDNSLHVVTADSSITDATLLDGFIITAGYANNVPSGHPNGGWAGLYISGSHGLVVQDCTVTLNYAHVGGGVGIRGGSTALIIDCDIVDNYSHWEAGGLCIQGASPDIVNCTFRDNEAYNDEGGGVYVDGSTSAPIFENCLFRNNQTTSYNGGGLCAKLEAHPTLIGCTFVDNYAEYHGGAIGVTDSAYVTALNCSFFGNSAYYRGGACYVIYSSSTTTPSSFINCIFSGNEATGGNGGALQARVAGSLKVINCSFSRNKAYGSGGGLYIENSSGSMDVVNCVLWNNEDSSGTGEGAQMTSNGSLDVNYTCVKDWSGTHGGTGNMGDDPKFTDADGSDDVVGTEDDQLRPENTSTCLDGGDKNELPTDEFDLDGDGNTSESIPYDIAGGNRILDDDADMGAYETKKPMQGPGYKERDPRGTKKTKF